MRRLAILVAWVCAGSTVVGFVLPWASLDLREPGVVRQLKETEPVRDTLSGLTKDIGRIAVKVRWGAESVTGDLPSLAEIPKQVSGIQIPQLANQKNTQVAMALIELLMNERQHMGAKSYAVYLLPGMALACALLLTLLGTRRVVTIGAAVLCGMIAGVGFWKLLTTNTQTLFIAITIGPGLWLSLWAYAALALAATALSVTKPARA
jgi:hypothetical protein